MPKTPRELLVQATSGQDPISRYYTFPAPAVQPGQGIKGIFAEAGAGIKSVFEQKQKYLDELKKKAEELELKERQWQEEMKRELVKKGINPETGEPLVAEDIIWKQAGNVLLGLDRKTGKKIVEYPITAPPPQTFIYRREGAGWGTGAGTPPKIPFNFALARQAGLSQAFTNAQKRLKDLQATKPEIQYDFQNFYQLLEWIFKNNEREEDAVKRIIRYAGSLATLRQPKGKNYVPFRDKTKMLTTEYRDLLANEALRVYSEAKMWQNVGASWPYGQPVPYEQSNYGEPTTSLPEQGLTAEEERIIQLLGGRKQ